ncbi:hypothetical protein E2562_011299 [Oryza meyeriana var. granulata]|uniref:Uncharacterized protein n=1 Tax=Oryza meyeriana var. granulata TaxID=110450 RepID=A0A6G1BW37_9ORYZ|nr:hypothetical protein E2562_011299 [Oryza meyeriana var. granulata]
MIVHACKQEEQITMKQRKREKAKVTGLKSITSVEAVIKMLLAAGELETTRGERAQAAEAGRQARGRQVMREAT